MQLSHLTGFGIAVLAALIFLPACTASSNSTSETAYIQGQSETEDQTATDVTDEPLEEPSGAAIETGPMDGAEIDITQEVTQKPTPETTPETTPLPMEELTPEPTPEPTTESTPEPTPEPTSEPALIGIDYYRSIEDISRRLIIPDLSIDVGLVYSSAYDPPRSQSVTDAEDSAAYLYDFPGRPLIAEHCYQAFGNLYGAYPGMSVWIYGQEYVCTETMWGTNTGEGLIGNGVFFNDIDDGQIALYTCKSVQDTKTIWIVLVKPV